MVKIPFLLAPPSEAMREKGGPLPRGRLAPPEPLAKGWGCVEIPLLFKEGLGVVKKFPSCLPRKAKRCAGEARLAEAEADRLYRGRKKVPSREGCRALRGGVCKDF